MAGPEKIYVGRLRVTRPTASVWPDFQARLQCIMRNDCAGIKFEEMYSEAYRMVADKRGEALYDGVEQLFRDHIENMILPAIVHLEKEKLLAEILRHSIEYQNSVIRIQDVVMFLDRMYVRHKSVEDVMALGLRLFRESVLMREDVQPEVRKAVFDMVTGELNGQDTDREFLKKFSEMLIVFGNGTKEVYETPFLEELALMNTVEEREGLSDCNIHGYAAEVFKRFEDGMSLAEKYLPSSDKVRLSTRIKELFLIRPLEKLAEILQENGFINAENLPSSSNIDNMDLDSNSHPDTRDSCLSVVGENFEDLSMTYQLFSKVEDGPSMLVNILSPVIRRKISTAVSSTCSFAFETRNGFISALLETLKNFRKILIEQFANDGQIEQMIQSEVRNVLSRDPRPAQFLSDFYSEFIFKTKRLESGVALQPFLEKFILLFPFIPNKDSFKRCYTMGLTKRLLYGPLGTAYADQEASLIDSMRARIDEDVSWMRKLGKMIEDYRRSCYLKETHEIDLEAMSEDSKVESTDSVDLTVMVLSTNIWAVAIAETSVILPKSAELALSRFFAFYARKCTSRKLTLQPSLGFAELSGRFLKRVYAFEVSTPLMVILMLFNEQDVWTIAEIANVTKLAPLDIKFVLASLTTGDTSVLLKKTTNDGSDAFEINEDFSCSDDRVILSTGRNQLSHSSGSRYSKSDKNEGHRYVLAGTIVRLLKANKCMTHDHLLARTVEQLRNRFVPSEAEFKENIDRLAELDYLTVSDDRSAYTYVVK